MAELLQGYDECVKSLNQLESGRFIKISLRRALKAAGKILRNLMNTYIPSETGSTKANLKVKAGPRRKNQISVLVGVFKGIHPAKGTDFYASFANYGHRSKHGKQIHGIRWTDQVYREGHDPAMQAMADALHDEIESLDWKSGG